MKTSDKLKKKLHFFYLNFQCLFLQLFIEIKTVEETHLGFSKKKKLRKKFLKKKTINDINQIRDEEKTV